jgi:hypothetical protein
VVDWPVVVILSYVVDDFIAQGLESAVHKVNKSLAADSYRKGIASPLFFVSTSKKSTSKKSGIGYSIGLAALPDAAMATTFLTRE